jgi:hypothetical protein
MIVLSILRKAFDRSKLHPEKVQVKGKGKQFQGIRYKGSPKPTTPKGPGIPATPSAKAPSAKAPATPLPGGGGSQQPRAMAKPMNNYPQGKGPKGGGDISRDPSMFQHKPGHKLGVHGKGLKPTGSFASKTKMPGAELPEEAASWTKQTIHTLEHIQSVYKKREPGQGKLVTIPSVEDLDLIVKNTTFACVSAGRNPDNPEDAKMTEQQIHERYRELKDSAKEKGYVFTDAIGKYGAPEESIMVMLHDADEKEVLDIGEQFHQQSVFISEKGNGKVLQTTPDAQYKKGQVRMAGQGFSYVNDADDFYTEVQTQSGGWARFRHEVSDVVAKAMRRLFVWVMMK